MKTIKEKEIFPVNAQAIWDIISDPANSSWVPTVEEISLDGDVRSFSMEGMGELKEKILILLMQIKTHHLKESY